MRASEFIFEDIQNLTQHHTNRLMNDAKFNKWFKGSKVKNKDGTPLICFHGTDVSFDKFRPFSHFGTMKAAHNILDIKGHNNPQVRLVFLSIKNPQLIEDDENIVHNSIVFLMLHTFNISRWDDLFELGLKWADIKNVRVRLEPYILKLLKSKNLSKSRKKILDLLQELNSEPGSFTIDEFLHLYKSTDEERERAILKKMKKLNIDGWYYKNEFEDKGTISWVITNSNQVWDIFK